MPEAPNAPLEPEFSAAAIRMAQPTGVPMVLFAGRKDAEDQKVLDVEEARLERQLEIEATMQGVEQPFASKVVQPQVSHQHPSNMPGWSRREWALDPFYGWRTQDESKIPKVPILARAEEEARQAAIAKRIAQTLGETPAPSLTPPPAQPDMLRQSPTPSSMGPLPPSAHLITEEPAPKPSWHDAVIKERILAATYTNGTLAFQEEGLKQGIVSDFPLPVNAAVSGYREPEANPARLVDIPDREWSERAPKDADRDPANGRPPSLLWFLGM